MSEIRIRTPGRVLISFTAILFIFYTVFQDGIFLCALILTLLTTLVSLISSFRRAMWIARHLNVKPEKVNLRMIAGSKEIISIKISSPKPVELLVDHPMKFCRVRPRRYVTSETLSIEVEPKLAGLYGSNVLYVETVAFLRLFSVRSNLLFKMDIEVIPRIVPAVIRAVKLVTSSPSSSSLREIPLFHKIGEGEEYAETREYVPGDNIRHIDWKATARLNMLMLKQFHEEISGEVNIIYDLRVAGPISADFVATELVNLAATLSHQSVPYRITVIDKEGRIEVLKFNNWREALITAIKYALRSVKVDYTYLYDIVGPHSSEELALLLKIAGEDLRVGLIEMRDKNDWTDAIIITCLIGDLTWLLDVWNEVSKRGGRLVVRVAPKVWLDSPTLEQAYMDYERQLNIIKTLRKRGIAIEPAQGLNVLMLR
ncbi:MAG: DUF58 domain-containing protein [Candidatus Korarchaeum sp.]